MLPESTKVSQSLAYDLPCKLLQPHADLLLLFLQIQLYNGLGALSGVNTLGPNDLGVAPAGIGHFIKNAGAALTAVLIAVCSSHHFLYTILPKPLIQAPSSARA